MRCGRGGRGGRMKRICPRISKKRKMDPSSENDLHDLENNGDETQPAVKARVVCEKGNGASDEAIPEEDEAEVVHEEDDTEIVAEEDDGDHIGVEEDASLDLARDFGQTIMNEQNGSDAEDSGDDIFDDSNIPDPLSSDDEEDGNRRENADPTMNADPAFLALGKTYGCSDDFKLALLQYSLKSRYDIKLYKSCTTYLGAKCSDKKGECPWRVYCSYEKRNRKMQIKVLIDEHTCVRSGYSTMLKRSTIAWLFAERLRLNPKMTKYEMAAEIKREYNFIVTAKQCAKAKTKLVKERRASHEAHFARIWDYQAEILQSNQGSTMEIEAIPGPIVGSKQRFFKAYICFKAQKESWTKTCRPIIGLDGAFLKWDVKGQLLAAVGRDGDNRIVPIAWAVVEIENDTNWDWFVRTLSADLGLGDGRKYTIMSDKQKGLVKAVHNVLPLAEHRMCARHIMDNWKKDNNDIELKRIFWRIARSYTIGDYTDNMEALRRYSPGSYASLQLTNPPTWSRAFFRTGSFCNDNLNNLNESFNRTIRESRRKPLLDMLEDIRRKCMVRNARRQIIANRLQTRFTKRTHLEIENMIKGSRECIRYMASDDLYEVEHHGVNYRVDMIQSTCGCNKWQLIGIPCIHATCVILANKEKVEDYVQDCYTTVRWRETYKKSIEPVQGMKLWPRTNRLPVLPPPWRPGNPGRPKNHNRRKSSNETASSSNKSRLSRENRIVSCSNCKQEGHNKTSCTNPTIGTQTKRPRGRPRKNQESLGSQQEGIESQWIGSHDGGGSQQRGLRSQS